MRNYWTSVALAAFAATMNAFLVPASRAADAPPATPGAAATQPTSASRAFKLAYASAWTRIPADAARLDVWLPVPSADERQRIGDVQVNAGGLHHELVTETNYGNRVLHVWTDHPQPGRIEFTCDVTRFEAGAAGEPNPMSRWLEPDRLGVIDGRIRKLAAQVTEGISDPPQKARAIYNYVIDHMAYDKVAPGWGRGDTLRACDVNKGNCTDFHALLISLARASNIPARFEIGFQIPAGKASGAVEGYHCWAEYWAPGKGWTPTDASEAWKHSERRDYYFGKLDADRVQMSLGRDVLLPGMKGEPLNYFLAPYAEADGKPLDGVERKVSFAETSAR